ncbi:uncharacterized protein TNIN_219391 [Trichonephila inaurata madagascariensis]|uniref:Uncharacterized protein n=1 Tax=Trichonephila inaurata madagascariensis TaxID=2747483 RepID=A0A8X7CGX8_9ARAC|nr:uncharacterized protein TNIN_219391 [Trichonephila inaurata madagascariensis]
MLSQRLPAKSNPGTPQSHAKNQLEVYKVVAIAGFTEDICAPKDMEFTFTPSLLYMAMVKTATEICRIPEIKEFITRSPETNPSAMAFAYSQEWVSLIKSKVSLLKIPVELQQQLIQFIRPISIKIKEWVIIHCGFLLCDNPEIDFQNYLHWKSDGTIDALKSSASLVQDEYVSVSLRYRIAGVYYLMDDARKLQRRYEEIKEGISQEYRTSSLFQGFKDMMETNFSSFINFYIFYCENPHALKEFFSEKHHQNKRDNVLKLFMKYSQSNLRVIRFCLQEISAKEHASVFETYSSLVLFSFMEWPFQNIFLKVADRLWSYITKEGFLNVMVYIYDERIEKEWKDYDYVGLLIEFWLKSPDEFKNYVRNFSTYPRPIFSKPPFALEK